MSLPTDSNSRSPSTATKELADKIATFQNEPLENNEEYIMLKHDSQHIDHLVQSNKELLGNLTKLYDQIKNTGNYDELHTTLVENKTLLKTIFAQDNNNNNNNTKTDNSTTQIDWEQEFGLPRHILEEIIGNE